MQRRNGINDNSHKAKITAAQQLSAFLYRKIARVDIITRRAFVDCATLPLIRRQSDAPESRALDCRS